MAYGGSSNVRSNFGRFQKYVTINISKRMQAIAEDLQVDLENVIADKLLETYKNNVKASYGPRSQEGKEIETYNKSQKSREAKEGYKRRLHRKTSLYEHTNILIDNIDVKIDKDKHRVGIILKNETYPNGRTVEDVHKFLTEGTRGGGYYLYKDRNGEQRGAYNYPTPAHLFEQHTQLQMKGFLESLKLKDYVDKRRYKLK